MGLRTFVFIHYLLSLLGREVSPFSISVLAFLFVAAQFLPPLPVGKISIFCQLILAAHHKIVQHFWDTVIYQHCLSPGCRILGGKGAGLIFLCQRIFQASIACALYSYCIHEVIFSTVGPVQFDFSAHPQIYPSRPASYSSCFTFLSQIILNNQTVLSLVVAHSLVVASSFDHHCIKT